MSNRPSQHFPHAPSIHLGDDVMHGPEKAYSFDILKMLGFFLLWNEGDECVFNLIVNELVVLEFVNHPHHIFLQETLPSLEENRGVLSILLRSICSSLGLHLEGSV